MDLLLFVIGIVIGMPLGWAVLLLATLRELRPREPKSKEEWKLM